MFLKYSYMYQRFLNNYMNLLLKLFLFQKGHNWLYRMQS